MEKRYLTERQVAEITGLSTSTLRNDRATIRQFFPFLKVGRAVRYLESDVLDRMERDRIEATGRRKDA